jgi:hypothetical protein
VKYIGVRASVMYLIDRNLTRIQDTANITAHVSPPSHSLRCDTVGATEITCKHRDDSGRIKLLFPVIIKHFINGVCGLAALILNKRK